jgi:hypothetical protein
MTEWGLERGYKVITVRIDRPGHDNGLPLEAKAHPSECELDHYHFDVAILNCGTLCDFRHVARYVVRGVVSGAWWV